MFSLKQQTGNSAEHDALIYLEQAGLRFVGKNYSCKFGEIDLIMQDGKTLVFVEVRYRNSNKFGGAAASVNYQKQQKIIRTAQHYLQNNYSSYPECRMDVVALDKNQAIDWLKNAIEVAA